MRTRNGVAFVVPGRPVPLPRPLRAGRPFRGLRERHLEYLVRVAVGAWRAQVPAFPGPVELTCRFFFWDGRHGALPPLLRAVEEGLRLAGVLAKEGQVWRYGAGTGIYRGEERTEVAVTALEVEGLGPQGANAPSVPGLSGVVLLPSVGWVAFHREEVLGIHPTPHAALRALEGRWALRPEGKARGSSP